MTKLELNSQCLDYTFSLKSTGPHDFFTLTNKKCFKPASVIGYHYQKSTPWTNQMIYQRPGQNLLKIVSQSMGYDKCIPGELKLISCVCL